MSEALKQASQADAADHLLDDHGFMIGAPLVARVEALLHMPPGPVYKPSPSPQPAAPQAGEVTDEQIDAATRHIYHNGRPTTKEYRVGIVRAILALRPQAVPMTDEQMLACLAVATHEVPARIPPGWKKVMRAVEAHHGITAKAGGGV